MKHKRALYVMEGLKLFLRNTGAPVIDGAPVLSFKRAHKIHAVKHRVKEICKNVKKLLTENEKRVILNKLSQIRKVIFQ